MDKLLQSKDELLRLNVIILLLRKNKRVDDTLLQNLAADDRYRSELFKKLQSIHKENRFPGTYNNQLAIARSMLASTHPTKEIFAIEYVSKQSILFKEKKGVVYFFKYKLNKEDDWMIGISGLQPVNPKEVSCLDDLVKFTGKKLRQDHPVGEQFNKQLKRLLFSKHKSAATFYLDNDYYAGRNDDPE